MPALDLAIALWVIRRCSHVRHTADPDELLEVTGYELRTIVADDPGMDVGVSLAGALNDRFDVGLSHVGPDLPVHDGTAEAVEQAAQEEKRSAHVDVGNIDVPVLMWAKGLIKTAALERDLGVMAPKPPSVAKHSVHAGRTGSHDAGVEHHEGETAVTFERILVVVVDDGLLLPIEKPPIAGHPAIVLIDAAIPLAPVIELADADADPGDEPSGRDFSPFRPVADVIDELVARVVGNPGSGQSSPSSFFSLTCSSISLATTSFLRCTFSRKAAMTRS
jgi:hypothetical protein